MPLPSGSGVGPYQIVSLLGAGNRFLVNESIEPRPPVVLVQNWLATLKK